MNNWEKRTERLEMPKALRTGEELARTIRIRAAINDRTISLEILHLLKLGIEAEPIDTRRVPAGMRLQIEREDANVQRKAQ